MSENSATTTAVHNTENTSGDRQRVVNRRAHVFMWLETMSDGVIKRVKQLLDRPVAFALHREFVDMMNQSRMEIFGDDGALYTTGNFDFPTDGTVIHEVIINTKTGVRLGRKVHTAEEASKLLTNLRERAEQNRPNHKYAAGQNENFGTPLSEALSGAKGNIDSTTTSVAAEG